MAERKRTILVGENQSSTIGSSSPIRIVKKLKEFILDNIHFKKAGLGGDLSSFERVGKPPVELKWDATYSRRAGQAAKSDILSARTFESGRSGIKSAALRERIRGKSGPRFRIRVKF